ncbi:hypothetical protein NGF19_05980 [Streptomyces sp. RY43-2]|uniref:Uncharacterized protein n=1 Tax=Streptomyces macrolidinus TaxID=2952607 RepID=A0ABT0ZAT9_9ACTN|nr:hypothetical protein [Streptomyces macrolidinus]MCN9240347.1 hypothetical protein [Streptomyces macrolidinus]
MAITDESITRLRDRATAGDPQAALELGKLLCLTAPEPGAGDDDGDPAWPEERWLRAAVEACPDDVQALFLLTGRLAEQISFREFMGEHGQDPGTLRRLQAEAEELYARIRTVGAPAHAEAGLAELAMLLGVSDKPVAESTYSYYVLEDEGWSGSVRHSTTVVACDADEIRWACDEWLALSEGGMGMLTLTTYANGDEVSSVDLGPHLVDGVAVAWDAVAVPDLPGPLLPTGLPVPGREVSYGFSGRSE